MHIQIPDVILARKEGRLRNTQQPGEHEEAESGTMASQVLGDGMRAWREDGKSRLAQTVERAVCLWVLNLSSCLFYTGVCFLCRLMLHAP